MLKSLMLLTVVPGSMARNNAFACPGGKSLDDAKSDSTTVDAATCCEDYTPICGSINTAGDRFACSANTYVSDDKHGNTNPDQTSCCEAFNATCEYATLDSTGTPVRFACPDGQVFNMSANDISPSAAACCSPFTADCGHITTACPIRSNGVCYDIFECAAGTTLNTSAIDVTSPVQANCCKPFVPTCEFNSGNVLDRRPYPCPAGKTANTTRQAKSSNSSEAACCHVYTPNCALTNDAGDRYACPAGKAELAAFDATSPSDTTCCTAPTCGAVSQYTCADAEAAAAASTAGGSVCSEGVNVVYDSSKAAVPVHVDNIKIDVCCKPAPTFSEGFTLGASSLSLISFLLLL